ncbi:MULTISPECIES: DUF5610 domain-containing protein [Thalassolituus]|jgi:hypothetical protein|uniref:DUF5610 domain-containing protein n=1 Tax=Thalassolituus maritimus TaxID=484498 RepID=A0A1N7J933_9GAMM|nr:MULTISPECIES: DUF5610 domain-containing protein [Thalassolituus]KZY97422.1 hypothetical protein A3746_08950 [Oleibacter sp. HI0075]MAG43857.1 hypothetical protein [Oceanospirillaceae bacterium]HCG79097.1 hypothetical protein [Oceanospirillales bacterium]MAX86772.1 hypothetical protein [Oceanospirillaceae bacterium]TPD56005.1 MAG: hypothetical protein C9355_00280 [Thalassolituus maritimus]|tara:strand:+ start:6778 stop:7878 length:1101 start_codon:yes stop_codon:yes gene_type:complete
MNIPSFSSFSSAGFQNFGKSLGNLQRSPQESTQSQGAANRSAQANKPAEVADTKSVQPVSTQSPEVTATNILRHVYQSVEGLRAEGASEERIAERLEAAREGIAKGYGEARAILEDLGRLDESLAADIDKGEALIAEGLKQIEAGEKPDLLTPKVPERDDAPQSATPTGFTLAGTRSSQSLSLEVVTRDGDKVTVNFRQKEGGISLTTPGMSLTASAFSSRFDMQIDGNLDEGELNALQTLFDDVGKLSETFYGGDLGAALEEAMQLGFDGNELASMSLELRQRSFSSVSRAYGESGPSLPTQRLESQQNMITDYVKSYTEALDRARPLAEPKDTLQKMLEALAPDESRLDALRQFNDGLSKLLNR